MVAWAEPGIIADLISATLRNGPLSGQHALVSAGPTFEDLDPVRYLGKPLERKNGIRNRRGTR